MPEKIFVSYTSSDREWAHWIGVTLRDHGYVPLVHEWEVGAGQSIARWMDEALGESDRLLGVFTDAYAKALYSSSERWSAYWDDPAGRKGFFVPVEVEQVTNWPPLTRALKRLSLVGLSETEAENALVAFLRPPTPPNLTDPRPPYPGGVAPKAKDSVVTHAPTVPDGLGERLPTKRPAWPTALDLERPHVSIIVKEPGLRWTINGKPVALGLRQLEYSVVNYGKTPAFLLVLFAKLEVGKNLPPCIDLSKQPGLRLPYGVIAGSDKPYDFHADWPSEAAMEEVGPIGKGIFLIGYLKYSDISDNHYMIGFCQMLDCADHRFVPVGDERYNYVRQVQQRQLEYLTYRDSDLSSAIIGMARCSAWGRWYGAQHLVKRGVVIIQRHLLHVAAGKVMDKMLDGDLEVRGRRPGKMAYESISRTDWRSSAFCVVDDPLTLWKIIICPRGGVRIEPDGTVHASDTVAAHRTAHLDYDSLIVDAYQFEKLWPKTDAIADKERHNVLAEARQRGLDKDEILRLSSPESPQQTAPPTISVTRIHAVEENTPAIESQLTGKQVATDQKNKPAMALADVREAQVGPSRFGLVAASVLGVVVVGSLGVLLAVHPPSPAPTPPDATSAPASPEAPPAQPPTTPFQPASSGAIPLTSDRERALKPTNVFKECDNCPEMVVVPAGSFTMGSPDGETDRLSSEGPQHKVVIGRPFAVGKFSVTFDEWDACVEDSGCDGYRPSDQGWGRGRHPVINVSWNHATAYAAWLSRKTGKTYRLLSEAEREYVARAGTTTPFWWGASISTEQANYNGTYTYGNGPKGENRRRTLPVDSFEPNPWGLYQVHGNVWEWTQDCWHNSYAGPPSDGSAWTTVDCGNHTLRGGSWGVVPWYLRAAFRLRFSPVYRGNDLGFRLGRTLTP